MIINGTDISMVRGDTETIRVKMLDDDGNKVPLGEGDKVYFTVKSTLSTKDVEIQKVIESFVEGEAIINITPEDTKDLKFRGYYYDIQLNRSNGQIKTIIPTSKLNIRSEVTDD